MAKVLRAPSPCPAELRGGFVSIGNFDGVHLGHARILRRLRELADRHQSPAVVFTFDPPPVRLLRPDSAPPALTWIDRKIDLISSFGVDFLLIYPTDWNLLRMQPDQFFQTMILDRLCARSLVEGPSFAFGRDRAGTVESLRAFCSQSGLTLEVTEPHLHGSEVVSSTRIRHSLLQGDVASAAAMLGRPHRIRGRVVRGQQRGLRLGFPTANLEGVDTALPADGVYAVRVWKSAAADDGPGAASVRARPTSAKAQKFATATFHPLDPLPPPAQPWVGAMNVGPNPTFGETTRKVEVHLVGFSGNLLGQTLEVDFLARLRDTQRFPSVDQLVAQLQSDVRHATEVAARGS